MTAIVGFVDNDKTVWMGGDSAGCAGYSLTVRKDAKVFQRHGFLYGFTSSFRMGQLIRYKFTPPDCSDVLMYRLQRDWHQYMATDFVDALRSCLKAGGFARRENEVESAGTFLVGVQGHLFQIDSDYQVAESLHLYDACGCGADIALGSLYTIRFDEASGESKVRRALDAAQHHSCGVRAPFVIESLLFV